MTNPTTGQRPYCVSTTLAPEATGARRRSLFASAAALAMAGPLAASPTPAATPLPDARLIALAHAFTAEELRARQHMANGSDLVPGTPEEAAHWAEQLRMDARGDAVVGEIVALSPAVTLAGVQALACALVTLDAELLDGGDGKWVALLTKHLVASLLALPGAGAAA